jgi:hypothetical protein
MTDDQMADEHQTAFFFFRSGSRSKINQIVVIGSQK